MKTYTCSKCHKTGHNKQTCTTPPRTPTTPPRHASPAGNTRTTPTGNNEGNTSTITRTFRTFEQQRQPHHTQNSTTPQTPETTQHPEVEKWLTDTIQNIREAPDTALNTSIRQFPATPATLRTPPTAQRIPSWVCTTLAAHPNPAVKIWLVQDEHAAPETLAAVAVHDPGPLCHLVATHPNVATSTLDVLSRHPDEDVRDAVADHPNTSGYALARLSTLANPPHIRAKVYHHHNTPENIRRRLTLDPDPFVTSSQ